METQSVNLRDITALKEEIKRAIGEGSREIVLDGYILEDIDDLSELNLDEFEKVKFRNCSFNFEEREFFVSSISLSNLEFYNCNFEGAKIQFLDLENVKFKNCTFDIDDTVSFREVTALYAEDTSINCRCLEIDNTYLNGIKIRLDEVYKVSIKYPNEEIDISFESNIDSSNGINGEIQVTTSTIRFIFDETIIDHGLLIMNLSHDSLKLSEVHMKGKDIPLGKNTIKNVNFKIYGASNHPLFLVLSYITFEESFKMELVNSPPVYVSLVKCRFKNPKEVELINIDLSRMTFIGRNEALREFYLKNPTMSAGFILGENILEYQEPSQLVSLLKNEYGILLDYKDVLEEYNHLIKNESLKDRAEHELIYQLKQRRDVIIRKHENRFLVKIFYSVYSRRYPLASLAFLISAFLLLLLTTNNFGGRFELPNLPSWALKIVYPILLVIFLVSLRIVLTWIKEKSGREIPEIEDSI